MKDAHEQPTKAFTAWDIAAIVMGMVIGVGIFQLPASVFRFAGGPWEALGLWVAGGAISFCGALCFAELAASYPRSGGAYEYLRQAYGEPFGFLFGWCQFTVVLSGAIGQMAYILGVYAAALTGWPRGMATWFALAAIWLVAGLNLVGVSAGRTAQFVVTGAKLLGLLALIGIGLSAGSGKLPELAWGAPGWSGVGLGLVFVLYTFGGWNDAAAIVGEVENPRRSFPLGMLLAIVAITGIYLLVNLAILAALGFDAARDSGAPAADALEAILGPSGGMLASVLVILATLGAINAISLTGPRVYAELGKDHVLFAWLGKTGAGQTPIVALLGQAMIASGLILLLGTSGGQAAISAALGTVGASVDWAMKDDVFENLLAGAAPVFWAFFLLTGLALPVLRWRHPGRERSFVVPLYPLPVFVFCGAAAFMLYSSATYAQWLSLVGVIPLVIGMGVYLAMRQIQSRSQSPDGNPSQ